MELGAVRLVALETPGHTAESICLKVYDTKEPIGNSHAVDETGGVYIVTDGALYRFDAAAAGAP